MPILYVMEWRLDRFKDSLFAQDSDFNDIQLSSLSTEELLLAELSKVLLSEPA